MRITRRVIWYICLCIILVVNIFIFGPSLDGYYFPVVDETQIIKIEEQPDHTTIFSGKSIKNRRCDFIRIAWYKSDGRIMVPVNLEFIERPKLRYPGIFTFGPWKVNLTFNEVVNYSSAIVYHKCHFLWETQTQFWKSALY